MVVLIRKGFGISAVDFGSFTMEVTWAAALLTMLPMTILCYIHDEPTEEDKPEEDRRDLRLVLVSISWIMFLYTFISRMIASYGPSQIGVSHPGKPQPEITAHDVRNIEILCLKGQKGLSSGEEVAFQVFALGGSLFLSLAIVGALGWAVVERSESSWLTAVTEAVVAKWLPETVSKYLLILSVPLWGIPQLWAVLRFRSMQQALAASIRSSDYDNSWGFGQIVAVTIFLPVIVEWVFVYVRVGSDSAAHFHDDLVTETK
jgi:hypothetical protein